MSVGIDELMKSRKDNLEYLQKKGIEPFPYSFAPTHHSSGLKVKYGDRLKAGDHTKDKVVVAGRVMAKRNFGKLYFVSLQDSVGRIQIVISDSDAGSAGVDLVDHLDVGDFIGVDGIVMKTKKGELSVGAKKITFLSKALNPYPEKFHGLTDIEVRYRKRPLDLIMNPEVKGVFIKRAKAISLMREFLEKSGFIEVEIPLLQPTYGGANARPFITKSHAWKSDFYLSISPELYLKRLIVGGYEKVYTICKNFRNEDVDKTHNPEFTMMECYASYWDYNDMMKLTEDAFAYIAKGINGTTKITYDKKEIDLKPPWKRMTMKQALKEFAKLDVDKLTDADLKKLLKEHELEVDPFKRGLAIADLFGHLCEDKLIQPTFIIDHPKETTPLCKPKRGDPTLIERFEPFINGWEVGNAYSELNDPELQEKFFKDQSDQGRAKGETHPPDDDFIDALRYGMPPTGGLGIGIDRLVMLIANQPTIKDVIFFPQMKPERKADEFSGKSRVAKEAVALINEGAGMQKWQELNTIAHLTAAFGARVGRQLFFQDKIETKDGAQINLNIQHVIMIKSAKSAKDIFRISAVAKKLGLEVAEFTKEMIETTSDCKVIEWTREKPIDKIEFFGALIFGPSDVVEGLTKEFPLYTGSPAGASSNGSEKKTAPPATPNRTDLLFQTDPYLKESDAKVRKIDGQKVYLDQTIFFAFSGGQKSDKGEINGVKIKDVVLEDNDIVHVLESAPEFMVGDKVRLKLDWNNRFRTMRLHSASHITDYFLNKEVKTSGTSGSLVDGEKDRSTYLVNEKISQETLKKVEDAANKFISGGHKIQRYRDKTNLLVWVWECEGIKQLCSGTHVKSTSEIGKIRLKCEGKGAGKELVETYLV